MSSTVFSSHTPSFSVYDLVPTKGSYYTSFSERRPLLAQWCKHIEEEALRRRIPTPLFAGFQQVRYLAPLRERYQCLSAATSGVWVFGERGATDLLPVNGVNYVQLNSDDLLAREWFLVVSYAHYARALIARETTPPGTPHAQRTFQGIITSEKAVVRDIHEQLGAYVGAFAWEAVS